MAQLSKHGLVVELNEDGQIIRSLHDPSGTLFPSVSEVEEENGILYLGSIDRPYVGRLSLARLPPPVQPGTGSGTSSTASPGRSPSMSPSTTPTSPGKSGEFFYLLLLFLSSYFCGTGLFLLVRCEMWRLGFRLNI